MVDKHEQNFRNCMFATAIAVVIVAAGALIWTSVLWSDLNTLTQVNSYLTNGVLGTNDYTVHLDSTAAALAITLPNDLSKYNMGKIYMIHSNTAQPHTVTIDPGTLTTTFDGVNTAATFGGGVGDGFAFKVISKTRAVVMSPINIVFN